jgi:hypothetical protein
MIYDNANSATMRRKHCSVFVHSWLPLPNFGHETVRTVSLPRQNAPNTWICRSAQILPRNLIEYEETTLFIVATENGAALAAMGTPIAMTAGATGALSPGLED